MENKIVYLGNYLGYGTGFDGNVYGGGDWLLVSKKITVQ